MLLLKILLGLTCLMVCMVDSTYSASITATNDTTITASPKSIMKVLTRQLLINCSLPRHQGSEFKAIISLILSKSGDVTDSAKFDEVVSVTEYSRDQVIVENQTLVEKAKGQILADQDAWISLQWLEPGTHLAGRWKCEAFGVDRFGHPKTSISTVDVTETPVDIEMALKEVLTLRKKVKSNTPTQAAQSLIKNCFGSNMLNTTTSTEYNNTFYHIRSGDRINVTSAQDVCKSFGGYLAEINTQEEYDFVRSFTSSILPNTSYYVMLGGTDQGHEGSWTYPDRPTGSGNSSSRPLTFTDWGPRKSSTKGYDCLYLHVQKGAWRMEDAQCSGTGKGHVMCEIHV